MAADTVYFLDTFTGAQGTTLADHVGEVGGQWRPFNTPWVPPSDLSSIVLNGAGGLDSTAVSPFNSAIAQSLASVPQGDHAVEIDFITTARANPYCGFCAQEDGSGYIMTWFVQNDDYFEIDTVWATPTDGGNPGPQGGAEGEAWFATTAAHGIVHTLRIELVGTTHTVYLNGTQMMTFTENRFPSGGAFWWANHDAGITLDKVRVYKPNPDVPQDPATPNRPVWWIVC